MAALSHSRRPPSEQLADLHIYLIPPELWRQNLHSAVNGVINDSISIGFIRVNPQARLQDLREDITNQIGTDNLPKEYVFLKSVGRCLTQVKEKQESQLRIKHFLPPVTFAPELFLLEGGISSGTPNGLQSSGSRRSDTRTNNPSGSRLSRQQGHPPTHTDHNQGDGAERPYHSHPGSRGLPYGSQPPHSTGRPPYYGQPHPQHSHGTPTHYPQHGYGAPHHGYNGPPHPGGPEYMGSDPTLQHTQSPMAGGYPGYNHNGYSQEPRYSPPHLHPSSPGVGAGGQPRGSPGEYHSPGPTGSRLGPADNGYSTTVGASGDFKDSADFSEGDGTGKDATDNSWDGTQTTDKADARKSSLGGNSTDGENPGRSRTRTLTKDEFQIEADELEGRSTGPNKSQADVHSSHLSEPGSPKLYDFNDQAKREELHRERTELLNELAAVKSERMEAEKTRTELLKKAKSVQTKTENRKNQAKELWKKRYFEQKKKTGPLEEESNKLQAELETIQKRLLGQLEGPQAPGGRSSSKKHSNLRAQTAKLQQDITELQRKIESAKIKLTAEMRLRNQAETELKVMKAEVTQRKNNINLGRQQVAGFRHHQSLANRQPAPV